MVESAPGSGRGVLPPVGKGDGDRVRVAMLRPVLDVEAYPTATGQEPKHCAFCKKLHGEGGKLVPLFVGMLPMRPEWITCRACAQAGKKGKGLDCEALPQEVVWPV